MTYTPVELYSPVFDGIKDNIFANESRAGFYGLCRYWRVGRAYDADAEGAVDSMGETEAIANCRTIFCSAEAYGKVVLGSGRGTAHLKGADVSVGKEVSEAISLIQSRVPVDQIPHGFAERELHGIL